MTRVGASPKAAAVAAAGGGSGDAATAVATAWSYRTLDGEVLDLTHLTDDEQQFFDRCYRAYRAARVGWEAFSALVAGRENPVVRAAGGLVTRAVMAHPLYVAVHDLENRVGLRTGDLAAEPEVDLARDPLADDWLSPSAAAAIKGVTRAAVHLASQRGDVVARPAKPGGRWTLISANSLARWTPVAVRQAAGRARASAVAT